MGQITVGQVENLEETIRSLAHGYEGLRDACQLLLHRIAVKAAECALEQATSGALLMAAVTKEAEMGVWLAKATAEHAIADAELAAAIASANPVAITVASARVAETLAELQQAMEAYERAKRHRMRMEQRKELADRAAALTAELQEEVEGESAVRMRQAEESVDVGRSRLSSAHEALQAYLAANGVASAFHEWLRWSPPPNQPVRPETLNARLSMTPEQQRLFVEYLEERDPEFRAKLEKYRQDLREAAGEAERQAVQLKVRKQLSGTLGEKMVEYAFKPLAERIDTQNVTRFEDGRYTKTDITVHGLKTPVILGRGVGMGAPAGGSIRIEVKCGSVQYLLSQKEHMKFQAGGHRSARASMTVCSRDIKDLSSETERDLRQALTDAGSPLVGMLPRKKELDQACWNAVAGSERGVTGIV
ncbi:hypothetical protein [Paenibacillus sabinae]|uniref:Uncharacterized protein n=1 Tax=Paenibacillus sabinae T27 TaxID=1268072 RepID=X4ZTA0_9BACL|nr:hypothetical protein [Paenibacillus sabinae]AHV95628.1 hypothetical protein PSAB_03460 [Paenibacillus sabinae T27]